VHIRLGTDRNAGPELHLDMTRRVRTGADGLCGGTNGKDSKEQNEGDERYSTHEDSSC
jgi:hypothetical protein